MTAGLPLLRELKIDGVDVSAFLARAKIKKRNKYSNVILREGDFFLTANVVDTLDLKNEDQIGNSVTFKRGVTTATENFIFEGVVKDIDFVGGLIRVFAVDKLIEADETQLSKSYDKDIDPEAGVISDIGLDLINTFTSLTGDATSFQDTGTTIILVKFRCDDSYILERLNILARIVDYQVYYKPSTGLVVFEPKGFTSISDTLTVGGNITNTPIWRNDFRGRFNRIKIKGGDVLVSETDSFNGNGVLDTFTLNFTPESVKVVVDGTEQTGGTPGGTSTFDYSVDKLNKQIVFEAGSIPGGGVNNVVVEYSRATPIIIVKRNEESITNFSNGIPVSITVTMPEIRTIADAETFALNQLAVNAFPVRRADQVRVRNISDLTDGVTATFIDAGHSINEELTIEGIEYRFPYDHDIINISSRPFINAPAVDIINERLKRIEQELGDNQDIIISLKDLNRDMILERRYFKEEKRTATAPNVFILDNYVHAILDTSKLGSSGFSSFTTSFLIPGKNIFKEFIYDTEFKDAGNTTATFDTTNNQIDFTDGEIFQSEQIAIGPLYGFITLEVGSSTGTLVYEISADNGNNFQTIVPNVRTGLTNSDGTGVILKVTSTGVSQIATTKFNTDRFNLPGIKLTLEE